jgi:N-acetylneuraminic acid mutarotase
VKKVGNGGVERQLTTMKKQTDVAIEARISRGAFYLLLLTAGTMMAFLAPQTPTKIVPRTLSFAERVAYQRAIEEVYWRHRIWPKENPDPKPSFDAVMSQAQLEKKVEDYLLNSQAVEDYYKQPLSAEQMQGEMDRMAQHTRQPEVLRELFEALGNDPFVIAECLARPLLLERMTAGLHVTQTKTGLLRPNLVAAATLNYTLPTISDGVTGCIDDTWTATNTINAPPAQFFHAAVWTGAEMIVWGGDGIPSQNTGGRYDPSTDSWIATTTEGAPTARSVHTAVWTGIEMIVWGGLGNTGRQKTGGRYNPITDSWVATTTNGAPTKRWFHTAVWTGTEMIVWGGEDAATNREIKTGGRYNPNTDSWLPTMTTGAPVSRVYHTAVWTGTEMVVWGGYRDTISLNSGGRYNPITDSWVATNITDAPAARYWHTAVWTDSEMIVWGGSNGINTGGRYNPITDSWLPTTATDAPDWRQRHTAVWTGTEMILWGGQGIGNSNLNTGGRYNPNTRSWIATTTTGAPDGRYQHTAVWTGTEMIVWGGQISDSVAFNTGGRYCVQSGSPTPTPTPTPGPITLRGQGKKVGGINTSRLKWRGATSANVDVYRDGNVIATTPNDGSYDDSTGTTSQASFTYQVCEAGISTCSNNVVVTFPQ